MDIECPYCEYSQEVDHDEGQNYEEGILHQMECENCVKSFAFYTEISFNYEPQKADCLNGSGHKWEKTATFPREFTEMRCADCGEKREPTKKEWKEILN